MLNFPLELLREMDRSLNMAQPNPTNLLQRIGITTPLVGFYDAPDTTPFEPLTQPKPGNRACIFSFYRQWLIGKTLHITENNPGCGGGCHWLFNQETRPREEFIRFLADEEGLKASRELMGKWLDHTHPYKPENLNILIGPLKTDQYEYVKTITFYVNPDQLSALMLGAQYNNAPGDPPAIIAPFGSGCMEMLPLFGDLNIPQALVGATDIAMRQYLPPDILAFTVTKPMFQQLCDLDEHSFLYKPFWRELQKVRGAKNT
jgi:hypothetical protein